MIKAVSSHRKPAACGSNSNGRTDFLVFPRRGYRVTVPSGHRETFRVAHWVRTTLTAKGFVFQRENPPFGADLLDLLEPRRNLQVKFTRPLSGSNDFVAYVDALGGLDGSHCLLEWKTTSSRYPEEPAGLLSLDPQLVCYSWITGVADVAQVVFVRKRLVEIQYLRTTITEEQREEFGHLVENTIQQIESGCFLPHSGIRFPQNPCTSCPYVGLCLGRQELVEARLVRRPGDDLGLFDELAY